MVFRKCPAVLTSSRTRLPDPCSRSASMMKCGRNVTKRNQHQPRISWPRIKSAHHGYRNRKMLQQLFAPQLVVLYILVASTLYVHFRGRERLRISRQLGDHSTYLSPYNELMYAGSAGAHQPLVPVLRGPGLGHPGRLL